MKPSVLRPAVFVVASASLALAQAQQPNAPGGTAPVNLALNKKYVSSDTNTQGWNDGLTDGSWDTNRTKTYATGNTTNFPKTVTIDLENQAQLGYVGVGVPPFGSTKTVKVALSTDGTEFTEIGTYTFTLKKEEKHLFTFAPTNARYIRLTYPDFYNEEAGYPTVYGFTTEVVAYAPGTTPVLPPTYPPLPFQPTDVPAPKLNRDGTINPGFKSSHESFLQRIKEGPVGLLFVGDSITNRWRNNNVKEIWARYEKYQPANFGIEGDQTQHVLWRFENGELDGINPKVVVVMIGTNNMGYPAADIVKGDTKIVSEIHRRLPNAKVLLLGIFPRGAKADDPARAKIKGINAELAKLDDGNKTRFLDFGDKFLDANGDLPKEIMPDSLHPNPAGYQIWADAMQPLLEEMMK